MEDWMISALTVGASVAGTFAVMKWRLGRVEDDRKDLSTEVDDKVAELFAERDKLHTIITETRETMFKRLDEIRNHVSEVDIRLKAIEAWMNPRDIMERIASNAGFMAEVKTILADHQKHLDKISDRMFTTGGK